MDNIEEKLKSFLINTWGWSFENGEWYDSVGELVGGVKDLEVFIFNIATKSVEAEQERIYKALVREEGFSGEIDCPIDPYEKTSLLEIKKAIYETSK